MKFEDVYGTRNETYSSLGEILSELTRYWGVDGMSKHPLTGLTYAETLIAQKTGCVAPIRDLEKWFLIESTRLNNKEINASRRKRRAKQRAATVDGLATQNNQQITD